MPAGRRRSRAASTGSRSTVARSPVPTPDAGPTPKRFKPARRELDERQTLGVARDLLSEVSGIAGRSASSNATHRCTEAQGVLVYGIEALGHHPAVPRRPSIRRPGSRARSATIKRGRSSGTRPRSRRSAAAPVSATGRDQCDPRRGGASSPIVPQSPLSSANRPRAEADHRDLEIRLTRTPLDHSSIVPPHVLRNGNVTRRSRRTSSTTDASVQDSMPVPGTARPIAEHFQRGAWQSGTAATASIN